MKKLSVALSIIAVVMAYTGVLLLFNDTATFVGKTVTLMGGISFLAAVSVDTPKKKA